PNAPGSVLLKRGHGGFTEWSAIFHPVLDDDHHVRWVCHSTTGHFLDPGTWRIRDDGIACKIAAGKDADKGATGPALNVNCETTVKLISFDDNGWTAERSRCNSRTDFFRARLGPNRLLEIVCIQP